MIKNINWPQHLPYCHLKICLLIGKARARDHSLPELIDHESPELKL